LSARAARHASSLPSPVPDPAPSPGRGLLIIGCLTVVTSAVGILSSLRCRCCLNSYFVLGVFVLLAQAGLVLYKVIAPEDAIYTLQETREEQGKDE
jgi:hypothetical protein